MWARPAQALAACSLGLWVSLASPCPARTEGLPTPDVSIALRDGRFLHLAPLPFGALAAMVVGQASFDASGTRAVVLAQFPGAGVHGDWRSANPTQAFAIDAQRRTITQLTEDGKAGAVRWDGVTAASVVDGAQRIALNVETPARGALPQGRLLAGDVVPPGSAFVSPKSTDRLAVYKTPSGRYAVLQIGARRFRINGTAGNGAYAIIGTYLAWIDGSRHIAAQIQRFGPDDAEPLSFGGSAYGDVLSPILPLGASVYQSAYRNGVAYLAFSYGVQRIVATTRDLVNFAYPVLPHEPLFTVGDGLGVSPDGALYFIRPEEDVMLFTRSGRYVRVPMTGLDAARDDRALLDALRAMTAGSSGQLSLRPDEDALDAALAQWRFYPVGDASGERWIASRLGQLLIADGSGRFASGKQPAFPFACLGRTDDGRLWGAAPVARSVSHGALATVRSSLWSSRDGVSWRLETTLDGDIGAVGEAQGTVWVALTRPWLGRPMLWLTRVDRTTLLATGGTFAGEQLGFADVDTGFYLFWGATPGRRLAGEGGPLSAYRIDPSVLESRDADGDNPYIAQRLLPQTDASLPAAGDVEEGASALLAPSLRIAPTLGAKRLTLRTNVAPGPDVPSSVVVLTPDQERAFEIKYAGRPYPLATVMATVAGDRAAVTRAIEYGPLHASGSSETWARDADGLWRLTATLSRFSY